MLSIIREKKINLDNLKLFLVLFHNLFLDGFPVPGLKDGSID